MIPTVNIEISCSLQRLMKRMIVQLHNVMYDMINYVMYLT